VAANQQTQQKSKDAAPGRPKLASVKPGAPLKGPVDPRLMPKDGLPKSDRKPKKSKKLLIMVLVVLVVAGGGFFAFRRWHHPAAAEGRAGVPAALSGPQATYSLSTLTVNLADIQESHFLRVQIVLQYPQGDTALATELKDREYIIDDRIISDLREKSYADLSTDQGEKALKQEIRRTVNGIVTKGKITGVYFDQFLIQ